MQDVLDQDQEWKKGSGGKGEEIRELLKYVARLKKPSTVATRAAKSWLGIKDNTAERHNMPDVYPKERKDL